MNATQVTINVKGKDEGLTMTGNEIVNNFGDAYAITVEGTEYLIYRDGSYTHAVRSADAERVAEAEVGDYTDWCDRVPAVADATTARAIMAEAGIGLIHLGDGCCTSVVASAED